MGKTEIQVEVVCATATRQQIWQVKVPQGATIADAIATTNIRDEYPELDLDAMPVGIFSRVRSFDTPVNPGDRIEIYRPLPEHPNRSRTRRLK